MVYSVSFEPVADATARILILGSLPGRESIVQKQYYAKPQNSFWKIMGDLIGAGREVDYLARLQVLKIHHIALWDVYKSAFRPGSLDSAIQRDGATINDFVTLFKRCPKIERICFNGRKAEKEFLKLVMPNLQENSMHDIQMQCLPSTSPAHASISYEIKLAQWRKALGEIVEVR